MRAYRRSYHHQDNRSPGYATSDYEISGCEISGCATGVIKTPSDGPSASRPADGVYRDAERSNFGRRIGKILFVYFFPFIKDGSVGVMSLLIFDVSDGLLDVARTDGIDRIALLPAK